MEHNYADRSRNLKRLGFSNYAEYLISELWLETRTKVFQHYGKVCRLCGATAIEVHHLGYGLATLKGEKLTALAPLCRVCHYKVEFDSNGVKKSLAQAHSDFHRMWSERRKSLPKHERKPNGYCQVCGAKLSKNGKPCKGCRRNNGKPWIGISHKKKHLRRRKLI